MSESIIDTIRALKAKDMANAVSPLTPRTIYELQRRYSRSCKTYGTMQSVQEAMGALDGEVHEVRLAIHSRDDQNIYDEFADTANVCIRQMQEMEARGLV